MRSAGRCGPLRVGAVLLTCAHAHAAALQVRRPHEEGLLLGEWADGATFRPSEALSHIHSSQKMIVASLTSVFFFFTFLLFKALGCSMNVPTVSVCELLDHLISIFCFYNGSVCQSYQVITGFYTPDVFHGRGPSTSQHSQL